MRTGLTIGPPEDITLTIQALGAAELCTVYGSTETYGNCAVTDAHDPLPLRLVTQGLPLPGMTIRANVALPMHRQEVQPMPKGRDGRACLHRGRRVIQCGREGHDGRGMDGIGDRLALADPCSQVILAGVQGRLQ